MQSGSALLEVYLDHTNIEGSSVILAKWQTRCPLCGKPVPKGAAIALVATQYQRWGHLDCVMARVTERRLSAARAYRRRRRG